jgi:hypothetical protein
VWCFFDEVEKNQQTPLQSCGTLLRAFFAVRKQHTIQVKPGETPHPTARLWHAVACVFSVRKQHTIQVKLIDPYDTILLFLASN